jgi:ATP-dependent exoDNAse (exonuclease V) beta subunit
MVLTKNKEVYLLDYKTGIHHQKHQLQLDKYQEAIELMGYKVVKKSLVYIGEKITVLDF